MQFLFTLKISVYAYFPAQNQHIRIFQYPGFIVASSRILDHAPMMYLFCVSFGIFIIVFTYAYCFRRKSRALLNLYNVGATYTHTRKAEVYSHSTYCCCCFRPSSREILSLNNLWGVSFKCAIVHGSSSRSHKLYCKIMVLYRRHLSSLNTKHLLRHDMRRILYFIISMFATSQYKNIGTQYTSNKQFQGKIVFCVNLVFIFFYVQKFPPRYSM